ncbi:protein TolR [Salinisphaera sp. USBA-960]|uniref:protein TolR n=1 Tax=Salinisphaera orenii TaxID=856731 RepID=UPI000DBE707C|nr:protein TolR [Salifodinibacter halophilus]NNC25990.1 protein TolR [Salifodinibacter halophilus]
MTVRTRRKRRLAAEINVVPYIDVMLVLLIIFMVTAPMLKTGVDVSLPKADAKPMKNDNNAKPIIVTVKKGGRLYLNVAPNPEKPVSPGKLKHIARQEIANHPKAPVSVKGDGKGQYGNVVRAMTLLQKAGASDIGLQTDNVEPQQESTGDNTQKTSDTG